MSAEAGFAAQKTMLPDAGAGAIVNRLVLLPPVAPQTVMVISESWTCAARLFQMSLGIFQLLPAV